MTTPTLRPAFMKFLDLEQVEDGSPGFDVATDALEALWDELLPEEREIHESGHATPVELAALVKAYLTTTEHAANVAALEQVTGKAKPIHRHDIERKAQQDQ